MKVLIDTNVLLSAALNPNGTPFLAYSKAVTYPHHGMICEQNVDELKRIFRKKFPKRIAALDKFLSTALFVLELVPTPTEELAEEGQIRDEKDRPILRAALCRKGRYPAYRRQGFSGIRYWNAPNHDPGRVCPVDLNPVQP